MSSGIRGSNKIVNKKLESNNTCGSGRNRIQRTHTRRMSGEEKVRWMTECNKPCFRPPHENNLIKKGSLAHTPILVKAHTYMQPYRHTGRHLMSCYPNRDFLLISFSVVWPNPDRYTTPYHYQHMVTLNPA